MQCASPLRLADHLDLAASDGAFAQHTNPLVIERIPFSTGIRSLQEREFFVGQEIRIHHRGTGVNLNALGYAISIEAEGGIREIPSVAAPP